MAIATCWIRRRCRGEPKEKASCLSSVKVAVGEILSHKIHVRQLAEEHAMRSPVDYFNLYQSLPIPSPDGSGDLASGISVDHYLLGAQQPYIDERLRLAKKVQKDMQLRKKEN